MATTLRNTDILFNDGTTQSTALSTTSVLNATAGAAVGAVGSYAFLSRFPSYSSYTPGTTVAGSSLKYSGGNGTAITSSSIPAGTWRCMGYALVQDDGSGGYAAISASLWLRIS